MRITFRPSLEQERIINQIENKSDFIRQAIDYYMENQGDRNNQLKEELSIMNTRIKETSQMIDRLEKANNKTNQKLDQILSMLESGVITPKKQTEEILSQENKSEEETNKGFMDFVTGSLKDFDI